MLSTIFTTVVFAVGIVGQMIIPQGLGNLRGSYINADKVNKQTILSLDFKAEQCEITTGMHCVEEETFCIAIAPSVSIGQCIYNNHTDTLHIFTDENTYNYTIYFGNEQQPDMTLINNEKCNSENDDKNDDNVSLLKAGETVNFIRVD